MKKEYLVVAIAVVLLGIGVFFSSRSTPGQGDQGSVSLESNNVVYRNSGFSPQTLKVDVGTTVTFTNQSGNLMWVSSDPHPIHTDYSSFDQRRDGDTYSFIFSESGTYKYHNHLVPSDIGTIIVE